MRAVSSLAVACSLLLTPSPVPTAQAQQQAQQPAQHAMMMAVNECAQPLSLLVSVVPESGTRETYGWFEIPAKKDQMLYVTGGSKPLMHTVGLPVYTYAKNADGSVTWEGGDLLVQYQGKSYRMERKDLYVADGPFLIRAVAFAC